MILKKYSLYVIAATLILSSCKKELDQFDPDVISEANAFQTFEHIQLGVNGAYARFGAFANDMYASALTSDEGKLGANNSGQGALTYRYQYSSDGTTGGDVTAAYASYYALIDQVNRVLPNIYTVSVTPAQESLRDPVKGQLLALRALAHFHLLRMYSKNYNASDPLGVPVMLVSNPTARPARNTQGEVMTQIEQDLADAKNLVVAATPANFSDTLLNKVNVAAFQARVALYKGDWTAAVTYSTEVITSAVKPLVTGAAFSGIWTDANTNEVLLRIRYLTSTGIGAMFTAGANIYIAPSDKLVASFIPADIRLAAFIGTTPSNYVNKFYASARGARVVDMKAMRTAEMYLIRAEANAKKTTPDLAAAAADINFLRAQRITGYVDVTFPSAGVAVTEVLNERFKELCFEGHRFWDLKRNGLPVQRNASDASPDWQTLAADSYRFVYPIPQSETNSNPNMQQNPGY